MNRRALSMMVSLMLSNGLLTTEVSAHATLVQSSPAAGAVVAQPDSFVLTFNEPLVAAFSSFDLNMSDGAKIPVDIAISKDEKSLIGTPGEVILPGNYTIVWHAAAQADGHRMDGALSFTAN